MTTAETIASAREHLRAGDRGAYARIMSAAIRRAMSDRSARALRAAVIADGMRTWILGLDTHCPLAAV